MRLLAGSNSAAKRLMTSVVPERKYSTSICGGGSLKAATRASIVRVEVQMTGEAPRPAARIGDDRRSGTDLLL